MRHKDRCGSKLTALLLAFLFLAGCAGQLPQPESGSAAGSSISQPQPEKEIRTGEIRNPDFSPLLTAEGWAVAIAFLDACFTAEEQLEEGDFSQWFDLETDEGYEAYLFHQMYQSCLIRGRWMRETDLSLIDWEYGLTCLNVREEEGEIFIALQEDSVRRFASAPETEAGNRGVHTMTLAQTEEGWKIREYHNYQDLGYAMAQEYSDRKEALGIQGAADREQAEAILQEMEEEYLEEAATETARAARSMSRTMDGLFSPEELEADNAYDRDAAVRYGQTWSWDREEKVRNEQWENYEMYGGDCQNFVSQCLYTGGIPMDWTGYYQWKWFGHTPNVQPAAWGRSPSWSGVKEFYDYCANNSGKGMVSVTDAPLGSLEPGDIVQFASLGNWRHSMLVTGVIRDENGTVQDLLLAGHSADRKNWPLSAMAYTAVRGIRILGWNE